MIRARERVVALSESEREFVERRRSGLVCKKCEAGQADLCVISRESRVRAGAKKVEQEQEQSKTTATSAQQRTEENTRTTSQREAASFSSFKRAAAEKQH